MKRPYMPIEPHASSSTDRLKAIGILSEVGIHAGILMMPKLPYLMETREHIL